jgi:mono/diheme cytochrome c family protein
MRVAAAFIVALVLAVAACGGGEEVTPTAETVEGEIQEQTVGQGDAAAGKAVFTEANPSCGSCHTFQAAGTNAQTGPNLNEALAGDDPQQIYESIVNPNAEITEGFQEGIMPGNYGEQLSEKQLADLVAFLNENKGP